MDRSRFTERATGALVPIDLPGRDGRQTARRDWAFVPNQMPPRWIFDESLWPLLVDAKEALGTLNGIGQTLSHPNLLLHPLQRREAIASSNIEGTFATPEQLLLYELDPREPRDAGEQMADWQEVFNYNNALLKGCELLKAMPICNRLIREVHEVLMRGVRGRNKAPGMFRKWQVQIGSTGRFIPPPASEAERLMGDLERYMNQVDERTDPLIRAYLVHYQFEAIHPFGDGNGRVGRLLLALMVFKGLRHSHPWLYLSSYFERYKDEYMEHLFNVSARGTWTEWVRFCLAGTIIQANDAIRRCHEFNRLYSEFHARVKHPTPRTHDIIESLFEQPVITITSISKKCNVRYNTAKSDIEVLVDSGILEEISDNRPKSFYSPEIMKVAYSEEEEAGLATPLDNPVEPPPAGE